MFILFAFGFVKFNYNEIGKMLTCLNCLLEYVCLCKVWHLYSSSTIYVVLFLDIYFWCEYMCVYVHMCVSCCVNTLLLMPHTSYIYDATHDKHILAVAATIGFSFFFLLQGKRNSGPA